MVLSGWKDIAAYLGRGVRTVQRWEANFGLPVSRPAGHGRSAVCANTIELDDWLHQPQRPDRLQERIRELEREIIALRQQLAGSEKQQAFERSA